MRVILINIIVSILQMKGETKAQQGDVNCPELPNEFVKDLGLEPQSPDFPPSALSAKRCSNLFPTVKCLRPHPVLIFSFSLNILKMTKITIH